MKAREDAKVFLEEFYGSDAKKGRAYHQAGRVREIICEGNEISTQVQGSQLYEVTLIYDRFDGWDGYCSCPVELLCKHVYATMLAWLASPAATNAATPLEGLAASVSKALGRKLSASEQKFFQALQAAYQRYRTYGGITFHELVALGFPFRTFSWDHVPLCPHQAANEKEFWLLIAEYITREGLAIPQFMTPVTHLDELQQKVAEWRRRELVQQWQYALDTPQPAEAGPTKNAPVVMELRLVVGPGRAQLAWKPEGKEEFEPLPERRARKLLETMKYQCAQLSTEGLLLWQMLMEIPRDFHDKGSSELSYDTQDDLAVLARLLRNEKLRPFIVGANGQPLEHRTEPLTWRMELAQNEKEDYTLQLTRPDGSPPPAALAVAPGHPPLYVTANEVFPCAPTPAVLKANEANRIPAPALETSGGLKLLQNLGLEFPPRLKERIRTVVMRPYIRCHLEPLYYGSPSEKCVFTITALSDDGKYEESWGGSTWFSAHFGRKTDGLTHFDRRLVDAMVATLPPLTLKPDHYGQGGKMMLKVTKQFPGLLAEWLKSLPPETKVELVGELASFLDNAVAGSVKLAVSEVEIDWFDLQVMVDVNDTTLTKEEIKLLLNAKGQYVRLGKKGWKRLKFDLTKQDDEELARLGLSPHALSAEPQRLHALQLADKAARKFLPEEQVQRVELRASEIKARVTPEIPASITAELRPYQQEGYHFLAYLAANHFGGVLADDMGLGKTVQALAWLEHLRANGNGNGNGDGERQGDGGKPGATLVVCPKSVMDNWRAEAAKFAPGVKVKVWSASELDNLPNAVGEAALHVINYSQLRMLENRLSGVHWLAAILDEGQFIKNPNSQTAQIARTLKARHRLVLSGTPIENRLLDLWSLMAFAMPGILGSRAEFGRIYDAKNDPLARRRLSARVRPFLLRRTKTQVAKDLPDRVEEDLLCEMEGEQKALYRAELKAAQQLLLKVQTQKELNEFRFNFLTSLLRLRQICCHPALVNPKCKAIGAKTEALLEQLEPLMEEGQKVLVFSQFVELIDLLQPLLEGRKWPVFRLTGATENRGELVEKFQNAKGAAIFLLSLKAGGFGLNLTAASYVVLFDPWWNPAVERQAIDRTHRIGQTQKVIAYRLLIKASIEEKIRALQKQKASLAEDVLGEEKFSQSLTVDDLRYLFAE